MVKRLRYTLLALVVGLVSMVCLVLLAGRSGPVQMGEAAGGLVRFVDGDGLPLASQSVRVLCYATASAEFPLADIAVQTDNEGYPLTNLPAACDYLAALRLRHVQPSGKAGHGPAYSVYATSWLPGSDTPAPATGDVAIYDDRPLVLFNVVASLAWQPPAGSPYLDEVRAGLQAASAYLYDLSEGQMAFGPVTIHTDGRSWDGADLRFLAANDYRPVAYMGGIVPAPLAYTTVGGTETVYAPGAVYLGRYWDGLDAADPLDGRWSQPAAFRTLGHEWGHYALFLYDEYQQEPAAGREETYCVCLELPGGLCSDASAMAYHYTASEWWLPAEHGLPAACLPTDQWVMHGEADWPTLQRWPAIQGYGNSTWLNLPADLQSGPMPGLAADLFGRSPAYRLFLPAVAADTGLLPAAPTVPLSVSLTISPGMSQAALDQLYPQFYTLVSPIAPTTLAYQGTSSSNRPASNGLGQIWLPGVSPVERGRVYVEQYSTTEQVGGRFVYPAGGGSGPVLVDDQSLQLAADPWPASLNLSYRMDGPQLKTMTVTLLSPISLPATPIVQRCVPAATTDCPANSLWRTDMAPVNATTWVATFQAPAGQALPDYGLLHVHAAGVGEVARWYQSLGGVGPGHMDGFAPLRDGAVTVDAMAPLAGSDSRVLLMPAAHYPALTTPLPPGAAAIVGVPFDLDIILPGSPPPNAGGDQTLSTPVALTFYYSQEAVDRMGAAENQLQLLHFRRNLNQWVGVPVSGRSNSLNWIAASGVQEDGIYAVAWVPGVPPLANFEAFPLSGPAPLMVSFFDQSSGDYSNLLWAFGDGFTSTLPNPQHVYEAPGSYTVTLTISGPGGSDVLVQPDYIVVQ